MLHSGRWHLVIFRNFQIGPLFETDEEAQEHAQNFRAALIQFKEHP